jgi:hypothetical protein
MGSLSHDKAGMRFGDFNDIKKESKYIPLMLQVNGPCHEGTMVWGSPGVGCEMETSRVCLCRDIERRSHSKRMENIQREGHQFAPGTSQTRL